MTQKITFTIKKTRSFAGLFFLSIWIAGFVIAKGFWSTLFAFIPFWGWYLVIESLLKHFSII